MGATEPKKELISLLIDELAVDEELFAEYTPSAGRQSDTDQGVTADSYVALSESRFFHIDVWGPAPVEAEREAAFARPGVVQAAKAVRPPFRILAGLALTFVSLGFLPSAAGAAEHEVLPGETLSAIAVAYGVSMDDLITTNGIENPDLLSPGDRLEIPDPPYEGPVITHAVAPGEALGTIAELYDVSFADLLSLNAIDDVNLIRVGDELLIPEIRIDKGDATVIDVQHQVEEGQSLSIIAETYDVGLATIMRVNGLVNPDVIEVGDVLTIPDVSPRNEREQLVAALERRAEEFNLDPNLFKGLTWHESGWQEDALSYAGAVGIGQLMPYTADYIREDLLGQPDLERYNAEDNIYMSAAYLAYLFELSDGDTNNMIASYYQGFTSVKNNGQRQDTQRYIANVLANAEKFAAGDLPG